eukprot:CAMPEP_0204524000 /NCGR_PEP_ID=MMETSP0661-20131031/7142_1 /ASSEMBLY_ACC=CAM_ASM_000606 /TAXON_ID=109239 /ORGANISM="Alexandrium margalefi, Strain AMGDE01CS-322" /LENGTH=90 /DNA_ID=CAMNT_0051529729 /DNA_START=27 /DNA_END=296 /DNA_ORIENTATION=-
MAQRFPSAELFVAGDSAGAGLALASTLAMLEQTVDGAFGGASSTSPWPSALIILSPYIDLTMDSPGFEQAMFCYDKHAGDWLYTNQDGRS